MTFQEKISPLLTGIHDTFWKNSSKEIPNDWSDQDMASATKIFVKVLFETSWNRKIKIEKEVAKKVGAEVYELVLKNTGIDLKEFYKIKLKK